MQILSNTIYNNSYNNCGANNFTLLLYCLNKGSTLITYSQRQKRKQTNLTEY